MSHASRVAEIQRLRRYTTAEIRRFRGFSGTHNLSDDKRAAGSLRQRQARQHCRRAGREGEGVLREGVAKTQEDAVVIFRRWRSQRLPLHHKREQVRAREHTHTHTMACDACYQIH